MPEGIAPYLLSYRKRSKQYVCYANSALFNLASWKGGHVVGKYGYFGDTVSTLLSGQIIYDLPKTG